ncbi:MAG: thioesterase family protein [Ilumatobacteraceae bacterium]
MTEATSLFVTDGDATLATELSRGPWDPSACHGGPVSALLVRACEQIDGGNDADIWQLARITVDLVRPVPVMQPMFVTVETERPGRNVSLVGARITLENGTEVAKARALRIRIADVPLSEGHNLEPPFSAPGSGDITKPIFGSDIVAYHRNGVEMRFAAGSWISRGPVSLWCRLKVPLLAGEQPTGAQRAAATADFSNGVSAEIDPADHIFINPDLSIHLLRPPEGEWIGMQARSHYGNLGAGLAEGALFDERGRCGRSVQSLFIAAR